MCECPLGLVRSQMLWNKIAFPRKSGVPLPGTPSLGASWTWSVADQGKHLYCTIRWLKNGRNNGCLLVNTEDTVSAISFWKIHFSAKRGAFMDTLFVKVRIFFIHSWNFFFFLQNILVHVSSYLFNMCCHGKSSVTLTNWNCCPDLLELLICWCSFSFPCKRLPEAFLIRSRPFQGVFDDGWKIQIIRRKILIANYTITREPLTNAYVAWRETHLLF